VKRMIVGVLTMLLVSTFGLTASNVGATGARTPA
jgi:hypothetical protein